MLANSLCGENDIWVVSLKMDDDGVFFSLDESVTHVVLSPAKDKLGMLRQIREIHSLIIKNKIEYVTNVDTGMAIYGILAAWGTGAKVITWEHSNFLNNWGSRTFPYMRRFAARHSHAMVVLTERDKRNYQENISRCAPVCVIPNPTEKKEFAYGVASRTILSAGLLLPVKQYNKAIEVAAKVLPSRPDWNWVICGAGPERARLEALIAEKGLQDRVVLRGTVRDMEAQYAAAAVFVMTSEMEGLPMVLLEAKAKGLPLLSFDIMTGPSDIIADGVNGYLVPADDVEAMADRLGQLMDDEDLRAEFSAASQLGMEKFSKETIIDAWLRLFEEI